MVSPEQVVKAAAADDTYTGSVPGPIRPDTEINTTIDLQ